MRDVAYYLRGTISNIRHQPLPEKFTIEDVNKDEVKGPGHPSYISAFKTKANQINICYYILRYISVDEICDRLGEVMCMALPEYRAFI